MHHPLDDFQAVPDRRRAGLRVGHGEFIHLAVRFHRTLDHFKFGCGRRGAGFRIGENGNSLLQLAVLEDFDVVPGLPDDGAGVAAQKGIAPEVFAALHGLEQE